MNDIQGDVRALTAEVAELKKQLESRKGQVNENTQVVRVEGMGSMWNGIAIGIALGATILGVGWISTKLQAQDIAVNQSEAYQKAVYMLAPRLAKEIDEELERQRKAREYADPDNYPAPGSSDAAPAKSTTAATSGQGKVR